MSQVFSSRRLKAISAMFLSVFVFLATAMPAWANEGEIAPGEDVTERLVASDTEHKWFYWPGWLFVGLVVVVLATMGYAYYKSVIGPKYRGRKVAQ